MWKHNRETETQVECTQCREHCMPPNTVLHACEAGNLTTERWGPSKAQLERQDEAWRERWRGGGQEGERWPIRWRQEGGDRQRNSSWFTSHRHVYQAGCKTTGFTLQLCVGLFVCVPAFPLGWVCCVCLHLYVCALCSNQWQEQNDVAENKKIIQNAEHLNTEIQEQWNGME